MSTRYKVVMIVTPDEHAQGAPDEYTTIGLGDTIGEAADEAKQFVTDQITREAVARIRATVGEKGGG